MINLTKKPFFLAQEDIEWVENTKNSMTVEEKIGQLFVPIGYSEIIHPPDFIIFFANSIFSLGYILSIPLPNTATVPALFQFMSKAFIAPQCE